MINQYHISPDKSNTPIPAAGPVEYNKCCIFPWTICYPYGFISTNFLNISNSHMNFCLVVIVSKYLSETKQHDIP